jgi:hypothetical protein
MKFTQRTWANTSAFSTFFLMLIWVLPNTIALRHFLLAIGAISGFFLIKENWSNFKTLRCQLIPLYAILGLFLWVGIHYCFFSLNPVLELSEIRGLWLRTILGSLMAVGLGVALIQFQDLRKYFYVSVFAVPVINILAYLYDSYLHGGLINPNAFIFFLFAKIETAYFGGIAVAVSVASIVFCIFNPKIPKLYSQISLFSTGILLVLISDMISNTKNGILIAVLMCFLLVSIVFFHSIFFAGNRNTKFLGITVATLILIGVGLVWHAHKQLAYKGWDTVIQDARVAMDIDKNRQWQYTEGTRPLPLNSSGLQPAVNTYSRVAWAMVGMRLISMYPWGYGSINQSFKGLQTYFNIYQENGGQAHNGWIDFGMAFGIPGLLIFFTVIVSTIFFAFLRPSRLSLMAMMICIVLALFCAIAEMSYKQYFESMVFFLTLSAALVSLPKESA